MAENNKLANAKIYRIVSNVTGENYYGSTCEPTLARRLAKHRGYYNDFKKGKNAYISSFKILETNNYDIVLVEQLENCKSKDELHARERYYIENNKCVNMSIPNRGKTDIIAKSGKNEKIKLSELHSERIEKKHDYDKEYRRLNREKQYKLFECECGGHTVLKNKSDHFRTKKHQQYIQEQLDNQIKISKHDFNFIFECDSKMLLPKTYPNIIPV